MIFEISKAQPSYTLPTDLVIKQVMLYQQLVFQMASHGQMIHKQRMY